MIKCQNENDCVVAALATAYNLSYKEVAKAAKKIDCRALKDGLNPFEQIQLIVYITGLFPLVRNDKKIKNPSLIGAMTPHPHYLHCYYYDGEQFYDPLNGKWFKRLKDHQIWSVIELPYESKTKI